MQCARQCEGLLSVFRLSDDLAPDTFPVGPLNDALPDKLFVIDDEYRYHVTPPMFIYFVYGRRRMTSVPPSGSRAISMPYCGP